MIQNASFFMLIFVPDTTFTQRLIMYGFFIGMPILLFILIGFVGYKTIKQNRVSKQCPNCKEFVKSNAEICRFCNEDLKE